MSSEVVDRFLKYVKIHTTSKEGVEEIPSTQRQFDLAHVLVKELLDLGIKDASVDAHCYVKGTLESNLPLEKAEKVPVICFLAHMDTSPEEPGENVKPQIVKNYSGGDIILSGDPNVIISPKETPAILKYIGSDIITSDGTTLLGGDDKAGIASIMTVISKLTKNPSIPHGTLKFVFTPDEEVGHGVDALDVESLGADYGYTLDGDEMGVLETETFNAAGGSITVKGFNFHPGYAKDKLINSVKIIGEIIGEFPRQEAPETTEKREGYYHVYEVKGGVNESTLRFILRDFDEKNLELRINYLQNVIKKYQEKYPKAKIRLNVKKQYRNMKYILDQHPHIIQYAEEAIRKTGVELIRKEVRGGTDGARLSFMGLPTPNIFAGAMNFHSKKEFVPVISMEKSIEAVLNLIQIFVENYK